MGELSSAVDVEARPGSIVVDPCATAIIVVDMQNDFAAPGGMFDRAGIPIDGIQAIVEPIRLVLDAGRAAGMTAVFLKMQFAADLSDAGPPDAPNRIKHRPLHVGERMQTPIGVSGQILVEGTWNTEIVPALTPEPDDLVVSKHRYSGFYGTDLDGLLRAAGVDTLIFTGATTSVCGVDTEGRLLSRLPQRGAERLHGRAHRQSALTQQPRGESARDRNAVRVGR